MPQLPIKSKTIHKSTGKPLRNREKFNTVLNVSTSVASASIVGICSSNVTCSHVIVGSIKKDDILDLKECPLTLPEYSSMDENKSLPRFSNLAHGENLSLDELDGLQLELELLLSSVLVRELSFTHQYEVIELLENGKIPAKSLSSPGKRSRPIDIEKSNKKLKDNTGKAKDIYVTVVQPQISRQPKVKCSVVKNEPLFDVPDVARQESSKTLPPKNDMINRFWAMVDTYCQEITADDVKLIEELINNQSEDSEYFKQPPLGKHYSLRWVQEDLMDEQKESLKMESKKKIKTEPGLDGCDNTLKEMDMNGCCDDVTPMGPFTQRLISGLVEENCMIENMENKGQGIGIGRPGFIKNLGLNNAVGLEKRIKKELQEQGIFDNDSCNDEDDEILSELKRCQNELKVVTSHNQIQLSRLLKASRDALVRHDLKKKLADLDAKVIEVSKAINTGKQKKKLLSKKDKELAWKVIKEREVIIRQLDVVNIVGAK